MPQHPKSSIFKSFKGINNVLLPERVPTNYLISADNLNMDKSGRLTNRQGYTKIDDGNYLCVWASDQGLGCYAVRDGSIVSIDNDLNITTLKLDNLTEPLSFEEIDGVVYFSSSETNGRIVNGEVRPWGILQQMTTPSVTVGAGLLPQGTYQLSITFVRDDGFESGTGRAKVIQVSNNSSISFTIPYTNEPYITSARIYLSTPDGTELYYIGSGPPGSPYTIQNLSTMTSILKSFGLNEPPKGAIIKYYRGRIYIADKKILWYSEPFQYEKFDLSSNFFEYPEDIRAILPVEDGIWVASDRLYYLSGDDATKFRQINKEYIKIIKGSEVKVGSSYLHMDNTPTGYKWLVTSDVGIMALFNQGFIINMTAPNLSTDLADSGTSVFLQDGGTNQYLTVLKTNGDPNNSVMGDLVESTIIRNGVIIT
jgi:hypothetical protein